MNEVYLYVRPRCSADQLTLDVERVKDWIEAGYDVYKIHESDISQAVDMDQIDHSIVEDESDIA